MRSQRGITLTEMLVTTAGASCLVAMLLPALVEVRGSAERTVCAANLSRLGEALWLYATDHDGWLPDCGAASSLGGAVPGDGRHFASLWDSPGSCAWPSRRPVGNQANLWLLVRLGYASPRQFICPGTADRPSLNSAEDSAVLGFLAIRPETGSPTAEEQRFLGRVAAARCSYSYQNQFAHPATSPAVADPRNATTHTFLHPPTLAVLADRNPYTRPRGTRQPVVAAEDETEDAPEPNSLNHGGAGQNVLYLNGEVAWHETPRCGPVRADGRPDHIYRPDAGAPDDPQNIPRAVDDAYLVP